VNPSNRLHRLLAHADHEGFELRIPTAPLGRRSTRALAMVLALVIPASVMLLALPGAAFVEAQGWWLVNEVVLTRRWLFAAFAGAPVALLVWIASHPPDQRLRLTPRALTVQRFLQRTLTVRLADLQGVGDDGTGLWLDEGGRLRRIDLPGLSAPELTQLAEEIRGRIEAARREQGSPEAVPETLRRMPGVSRTVRSTDDVG